MFESARSHHHIEHVDEFLSPGAAAQAKDTGSQQPVAQKNIAALDPVNARDVLKVDNLDMLAAESALLEHLDAVRVDLDVFKPAEPLSWNSKVLLSISATPMRFDKTVSMVTF